MPLRSSFWCVVLIAGLAVNASASTLLEEQRALYESNEATFQRADDAAVAGDTAEGNRVLREFAEQSGRPAAFLLVANMLYNSDRATSYAFHHKAWEAFPDDPDANLEWAMERHRRGEYLEAIKPYQKYLASEPGSKFQALLADCLVHAGRLNEAVGAWQAANHPRQHTAIDFAICEIYGPLSPMQRRGDLLAKIRAGDASLLQDLILLDLHFDRDWWNADAFGPGLELDLPLAREKLGPENVDFRLLEALSTLAQNEEPTAGDARAAFAAAGFDLMADPNLPVSSRVARAAVERIVAFELVSPERVWEACQEELWRRARSQPGDRDALHLLALVAAQAKNGELAKISRFGWERWRDPDFGASLVVDTIAAGDNERAGELLAVMRAAAPKHAFLAKLAYQFPGSSPDDQARLVEAIKAEFSDLTEGMIIRDTYTLKALFARLQALLASAAP